MAGQDVTYGFVMFSKRIARPRPHADGCHILHSPHYTLKVAIDEASAMCPANSSAGWVSRALRSCTRDRTSWTATEADPARLGLRATTCPPRRSLRLSSTVDPTSKVQMDNARAS